MSADLASVAHFVLAMRMAAQKKTKKSLSVSHKEALADGRTAGNAVRRYLEAVENNRPKRGRKRTVESVTARLDAVNAELAELADSLSVTRLLLLQEQENLEAELANPAETVDLEALEADFIVYAKSYGESKGISYKTWRAIGIAPKLLDAAGIPRTRG